MNKAELINEISLVKENMRSIVDLAEAEKRELNDAEKAEFEEKNQHLTELKSDLEKAEAEEQKKVEAENRSLEQNEEIQIKNKQNIRMNYKENLAKEIVAIANSRSVAEFDNVTGNTIELNKRSTTLYGDVDEVQSEERLDILEPLQDALLVDKLGIKVINTGKAVKLPSVNNVEATIEGEVTELAGQKIEFNKTTVNPVRVGISMPFSGTAVKTADVDLVNYAINLAGKSVARLANKWLVSPTGVTGKDSSTAHMGPFAEKLAGDASVAGAVNWQTIVGLEAEVKAKNVDVNATAAYVMSPKTEGKLKSAPVAKKDAGSGRFIIEDGKVNGYPYLVSQACVDASGNDYIGFGVFDNVLLQNVGDPTLVVDNLSRSKEDIVEVNLNTNMAFQTIRPEAFAAIKLDASSFIA